MRMLNLESTIKSSRLPSAIIFSTLRGCEISAKSQLHYPAAPQRMLRRCIVRAVGWAAAAAPRPARTGAGGAGPAPPAPARRAHGMLRCISVYSKLSSPLLSGTTGWRPQWWAARPGEPGQEPLVRAGKVALGTVMDRECCSSAPVYSTEQKRALLHRGPCAGSWTGTVLTVVAQIYKLSLDPVLCSSQEDI